MRLEWFASRRGRLRELGLEAGGWGLEAPCMKRIQDDNCKDAAVANLASAIL